MGDVDQSLPQTQTDTPVVPQTPAEQAVNGQSISTPIDPEVLLRDFLAGKPIAAHPVINIQIAPMDIQKMQNGGVVITPSGEIVVNYK